MLLTCSRGKYRDHVKGLIQGRCTSPRGLLHLRPVLHVTLLTRHGIIFNNDELVLSNNWADIRYVDESVGLLVVMDYQSTSMTKQSQSVSFNGDNYHA